MKKSIVLPGFILALTTLSCKKGDAKITPQPVKTFKKAPVRKAPKTVTYTLENTKEWLKTHKDSVNLEFALALNRTDKAFFTKMDSVIIPTDMSGDSAHYLPFPLEVPYLTAVYKILFFSYPTRTFAAYENDILTYTGPTNKGKKKNPTPTGLLLFNFNLS